MLSESTPFTGNQEHAELLRALRESELLRELAELLASSLDPTGILQVLVRRTTEVCDVQRCAVWLLDEAGTCLQLSSYHLSTQSTRRKISQNAERRWQQSTIAFNDPLFQHLRQENGILVLEDLREQESWRKIAENCFMHSVLLIALVREERTVGMISLDNPGKVTLFSKEQQQLARTVGQQAAVAIDNAQLYQQAQAERKRAEWLSERAQSIYEVAIAVNSGENLPQILETATQHLVKGLDVQRAIIVLQEKDTLTTISGISPIYQNPRQGASDGYTVPDINTLQQCQAARQKGRPHFVHQVQFEEAEKLWFQQMRMESVMIVPLMTGSQPKMESATAKKMVPLLSRGIGFIFINYPATKIPPTAEQYTFAQEIATQCVLAIEKAEILTKAQQAVELANERANTLDAVFNAMTEGIIVLDMSGKVIISNERASQFINLTRNARKQLTTYLKNHPLYTLNGQLIPEENFPLVRALHGEYIRGERFMSKRRDGSEYASEVNIEPLLDSEERQIGIVSAFRDITEPLRIERRIRLALDIMLHAAEVVSGLTDIQEILSRVLTMTMKALNSERGVVLQYNHKEQEFTPLFFNGFLLEETKVWLAEQKPWLRSGTKSYASIHRQLMDGHATLMNTRHHQEQSDVDNHTMLAAPIAHNKQLLGVMLFERSSQQQREEDLAEQSPNPITQPLIALEFSAWDMAVVEGIAQFAGLAIEQARWQQEAEIARTNEASMRESNALKDEFLAITAHEFRTPLTVILAHGQMMARLLQKASDVAPELRERLNESISFIEEQTRQLTNIVNTFLEVTRINKGQIELVREELNLEDVLKEAVENYRAAATNHEISYQVEPQESPYLLIGDRARILQIFANLLQNAIKYSPWGGPIIITLTQQTTSKGKKMICICVADKGIGIAREAQPHLFERFYRAPGVMSGQARGIGLGLYVVAEFLYLHGGTIRIESSGVEGEGSRFIFTLPLLSL